MQWFHRVANTAIERQNYLEATLKHASELEQKVDERTMELKENNKELTKLLGEVQNLKLQQDRDYFLLSLLIEPLVEISFESNKIDKKRNLNSIMIPEKSVEIAMFAIR
jgi:nitrate/nitrite-specific signal transduction histidine kinase